MPGWLIFTLGLIAGAGLYLLYDKYASKAEAVVKADFKALEDRVIMLEKRVQAAGRVL